MRTKHWAPYTPDEKSPWDVRRVVHLHRRAAFAASWAELERDRRAGPDKSVARVLTGGDGPDAARFGPTSELLARAASESGSLPRLKAWWLYRMLFTPDPLAEKLALLWHDHFATAHSKVRDVGLMKRQNDTFRKHARGRFTDLAHAAVREPALLVYLDAPGNRKGHPNENLARELMELFTLGLGHFAEADVQAAARCLTGWTVEEDVFAEHAGSHDDGEKCVLGKTGRWTGSDLLKVLLEHPATAGRVASRLAGAFFGEGGCPPDALKELATGLRERDLDIVWAVGTILRSGLFFADANIRTRVLSPVEFVVGAARALGLLAPAPSTLALGDWAARMGQDLFEPPNVGGWPGGRAWINTRSLAARANFSTALLSGRDACRGAAYDPAAESERHGFGSTTGDVLTYHHRLLFGTDPPPDLKPRVAGLDARSVVALLLGSPGGPLG